MPAASGPFFSGRGATIHGYTLQTAAAKSNLGNHLKRHATRTNKMIPPKEDWRFGRDTVNIMQYTGLKDKNGKEIYEGDIVRMLYTDWRSQSADDKRTHEQYKKDISVIGTVEFKGCEFGLHICSDILDSLYEGKHGEKEIIGNIYENPELI